MTTTVIIKGTHCKACKMLLEDVCLEMPGVQSCSVDFATGKTVIEYSQDLSWETLQREVEEVGEYQLERAGNV